MIDMKKIITGLDPDKAVIGNIYKIGSTLRDLEERPPVRLEEVMSIEWYSTPFRGGEYLGSLLYPVEVPVYECSTMGESYFTVDGITFNVLDLREMREDPDLKVERYTDICVLGCYWRELGMDIPSFHLVPNAWLFGSSLDEFNDGMPVHEEFLNATKEYTANHHLTESMQDAKEDNDEDF